MISLNTLGSSSAAVVLPVATNTASKCAYTPQYDGLEKLYARYQDRGLIVAGFPSNDFAGQEPGTEKQIQDFCRLTYAVEFAMFEKVQVKGPSADPFYQHLARVAGEQPRWNFHNYVIDRHGRVVASFPSQVTPEDRRLVTLIEDLLLKVGTAWANGNTRGSRLIRQIFPHGFLEATEFGQKVLLAHLALQQACAKWSEYSVGCLVFLQVLPGFAQQLGAVTLCTNALELEVLFNSAIAFNQRWLVTAIPVDSIGTGVANKL